MKNIIIEITVYEYDDLFSVSNRDILDNVLEKNRDINIDYDGWYESIYEDFKEDMSLKGIEVSKIYFSGFYSQGDGAIFEVDRLDIIDFLKANKLLTKFKKLVNEIKKDISHDYGVPISKITPQQLTDWSYGHSVQIKQRGHYYHENSYLISFNMNYDHTDDFENYLEDFIETNAKQLYKNLRNYYEELQKDIMVLKTLQCNEYEFNANGTIN